MNDITLTGILKGIEPSHCIDGINFSKAKLICKRENGIEDVIDLKFKSFSNRHKENDLVHIKGNLRSYSYKVENDKNKVSIYAFTYFDEPDVLNGVTNEVEIDGRICKINPIRTTKNGSQNIHFILANNLTLSDSSKRLNSYIPCIAWGKTAKKLDELEVSTKIKIKGELHSREHKKVHEDNTVEIRVAHELFVKAFEVID